MIPVFDGHNDLLDRSLAPGEDPVEAFRTGTGGHLDVPRARAGGFGGGFFAVWLPSPVDLGALTDQMLQPAYDMEMPPPLDRPQVLPHALSQIALLDRLEVAGLVKVCTSAAEIETCLSDGPIAAILHFEGAEVIDPEFEALDVFYRAGLRSLGPVWSRNTIFANGVPFRYPSTGDIGAGLTDHGERLVAECNRRRIMLDLSHLNEAGFWDVARLSDAPLVATHSNAWAVCPHARNLTDKQLAAIAESDGMVGLNFATAFLRPDGQMAADCAMDVLLRHLDHMISIVGEDRIGLGSDFDGAVVPEAIKDVAGLTVLRDAMSAHGYDDELMTKICHGNWIRVLRQTWGA